MFRLAPTLKISRDFASPVKIVLEISFLIGAWVCCQAASTITAQVLDRHFRKPLPNAKYY